MPGWRLYAPEEKQVFKLCNFLIMNTSGNVSYLSEEGSSTIIGGHILNWLLILDNY